MSVPDEKGNPPLWLALENNLEDIASTLVRLLVVNLALGLCISLATKGSQTEIKSNACNGVVLYYITSRGCFVFVFFLILISSWKVFYKHCNLCNRIPH